MSNDIMHFQFEAYACLFCGKSKREVFYLVTVGASGICDECVDVACVFVDDARKKAGKLKLKEKTTKLTALKIKELLDETIIGQDQPKKILSVAAVNHLKRMHSVKAGLDISLPKNNVLLLGPTGSGKTYLIQKLGKILGIPVVIGDASRITQSGYIGDKLDDVFLQLLENANKDKEAAKFGIVYLDEIDKLASSGDRKNDVGGQRVQEELLRAMEGSELNAERWAGKDTKSYAVNTENILFIFGGAFVGLDEIIHNRLNKTGIGFTSSVKQKKDDDHYKNIIKELTTEDLIAFGFIPEFLGRISTHAILDPLTEEDLYNILANSKDSVVSQYKALFEIDNINLNILPNAFKLIAKEAIKKKIGARGLKSEFEKLLLDHLFEISNNIDTSEIVIDSDDTSDVPKFQAFRR